MKTHAKLSYLLCLGPWLACAPTQEGQRPQRDSARGEKDDQVSDLEIEQDSVRTTQKKSPSEKSTKESDAKGKSPLGVDDNCKTEASLTAGSINWMEDMKPLLAQNCTSCHNERSDATDFTKYNPTFRTFVVATNEEYDAISAHADVPLSAKNETFIAAGSWYDGAYQRGEGFSEWEVDPSTAHADLEQDYTDGIRVLLEDKCVVCHTSENLGETWFWTGPSLDDFTVLASKADSIVNRLVAEERPMPPLKKKPSHWGPTLTTEEIKTISDWLSANMAELKKVNKVSIEDSTGDAPTEPPPCG